MLNEQVSARQMMLWVGAAVSAPLAIYAGSSSWEWTLIVGTFCTATVVVTLKFGEADYGILLRVVQSVVLAIAAGTFAKDISACWGEKGLVMPMTLIVLAALSATGGAERTGRVSCVVAWIMAILYIIVLVAGTKNLEVGRLKPDGKGSGMLAAAFLIPAVILMIPRERRKRNGWLYGIPVFAVVVSIWCAGTLSRQGAMAVEIPFYEYSKSLNLLGMAERFEALGSVALTLGMFCLISFLLSAAEHMMKNGAVFAGAGAALVASGVPINPMGMVAATSIFWIGFPLAKGLIKNRKNVKKVLDKNEPK